MPNVYLSQFDNGDSYSVALYNDKNGVHLNCCSNCSTPSYVADQIHVKDINNKQVPAYVSLVMK